MDNFSSETATSDRRGFLRGSALIAATVVSGVAQARARTSPTGAPSSFGPIRQVDAGVLDIGYVEMGPASGTPVLLFHGDKDLNVGVPESREMAGKLKGLGKQVDYVEFKGLDHQLQDNDARITLLDKSDRFIRTALGLPLAP